MARTLEILCCALVGLTLFAVCTEAASKGFAVKCFEECKDECKPNVETVCRDTRATKKRCEHVQKTRTVPECVKACPTLFPLWFGLGKDAGCSTVCKDVVKHVIEEECWDVSGVDTGCKTTQREVCKKVCKQNCDGTVKGL